MEQALLPDLDAAVATFRAFNRWMDEDWGFAYKERIFAAPYITLCKPDSAVRELEWALERDARFIVMIPGPITTEVGMRAPGDPMFDDFWRLANDSGITVCYHSGETYYSKFMPAWGESDYMMSFPGAAGLPVIVLRGRNSGHLRQPPAQRPVPAVSRTCGWPPSKAARRGCSTCSKS